jgi:hypothetical protein
VNASRARLQVAAHERHRFPDDRRIGTATVRALSRHRSSMRQRRARSVMRCSRILPVALASCVHTNNQQQQRELPMRSSEGGDEAPLFVLASRLYVHYKFKTRKSINPQAMLIDDDYAREVLSQVRRVKDAKLQDMAARFEQFRFGGVPAPKAVKPGAGKAAAEPGPMLDFPLEEPT